jgi:Arc/MetJ-type ribon-helix-helix transcriptional regulator
MEGKRRRITVKVPRRHLKAAQAYTGAGISETVRAALRMLAADRERQLDLAKGRPTQDKAKPRA